MRRFMISLYIFSSLIACAALGISIYVYINSQENEIKQWTPEPIPQNTLDRWEKEREQREKEERAEKAEYEFLLQYVNQRIENDVKAIFDIHMKRGEFLEAAESVFEAADEDELGKFGMSLVEVAYFSAFDQGSFGQAIDIAKYILLDCSLDSLPSMQNCNLRSPLIQNPIKGLFEKYMIRGDFQAAAEIAILFDMPFEYVFMALDVKEDTESI